MKRALWLVLITIPFILSNAAAEKITTDPNTPEARANLQNGNSDPRLAQEVTYDCKVKPVREVLAELSEKTGVTLVAGSNGGDWHVRDAKVTMFMKDVRLAEVMDSIARVMKFAWSRSGDKPGFSYRLVDDRQAVKDLEDRLSGKSKEFVAKRRALIAQLEAVAALSEPEITALKDTSPYLYVMGKSGLAAAFVKFKRQVPQIMNAMINGECLAIKYADLSKPAQASILDIMRCGSWMATGDPTDMISEEELREWAELSEEWTIRFEGSPDDGYMKRPDVMGLYGFLVTGRYGGVPLADPDHPYIRMMSRQVLVAWESKDKDDIHRPSDEEQEQMHQMEQDARCLEPMVEHQRDPELQVEMKLDEEEWFTSQADTVEYLAEISSFSFITDSYKVNDCYCCEICPSADDATLQDILQEFFSDFNWQRRGSIIEIWDRNWLTSRAAEIPDGLMLKLEKQIQETGTLDLDCIAELASLTEEQLEVNLSNNDLFDRSGNLLHQLYRSGEYLKVYNKLSKSQRNRLFSSKGLGLSDLSPAQRTALLELVNTTVPSQATPPDFTQPGIDLRATATREWDGRRYIYTIRGAINGVPIPGEYIISSPIFEFRTHEEIEKYYQEMEADEEYSEDGEYYEEEYNEEDSSGEVYEESYDEDFEIEVEPGE